MGAKGPGGILQNLLGTICIASLILGGGAGCAAHFAAAHHPSPPIFEDMALFTAVVQALAAERTLPLRVDPRPLDPRARGTRRSSEDLAAISAENLDRRAVALTALGIP